MHSCMVDQGGRDGPDTSTLHSCPAQGWVSKHSVPILGSPQNTSPIILGSILGPLTFRSSHIPCTIYDVYHILYDTDTLFISCTTYQIRSPDVWGTPYRGPEYSHSIYNTYVYMYVYNPMSILNMAFYLHLYLYPVRGPGGLLQPPRSRAAGATGQKRAQRASRLSQLYREYILRCIYICIYIYTGIYIYTCICVYMHTCFHMYMCRCIV